MKNNFLDNNFFIIDSNNLNNVKTKLYGYCIYEDSNLGNNIDVGKIGVFVDIICKDYKIFISQDINGSYGLYLYRDGDYFALSNSFMYLVDYLKIRNHKITLNKDYANYLITVGLCSEVLSSTLINEIEILYRNAKVEIDILTKTLKIDYIDYKENTVEIGSSEFFDILDNWYYRWINIIRVIKAKNRILMTDLSGGYDSRIVLLLFLGSGIDLNDISIRTYTDGLHCHSEDFEIASQIANDFKFTLNKPFNIPSNKLNIDDRINLSFYVKLGFHKEMAFRKGSYKEPIYRFAGNGGELIRDYHDFWNSSNFVEFIQQRLRSVYGFSKKVRSSILQSLEKELNLTIEKIKEKFNSYSLDESDLLSNLYRETRCVNHYGKSMVEQYLSNTIQLSPFFDSELQKLKLISKECSDRKLLLSIIFTRYAPNLLNYKIEGNRNIDKNTIEFAKKINKNFPILKKEFKEYKIINSNSNISNSDNILNYDCNMEADAFLLNFINSPYFKDLFKIYFNSEVLNYIYLDIKRRKFHSLRHAYGIIGITKIINDVFLNEKILNSSTIFDFINNFFIESKDKYYLFKTEELKSKDEAIAIRDSVIKNKDSAIKQKNNEVQNLNNQNNIKDQVIKRLQNSWSYRIGRLFTYPLSIPLDFLKFIRDYNLIKKSGLFDREYYLANNEDVKNAKMNPIKHYLKFGWKEGRNPSAEFDGNEYLNKRSDVRVAGICPLLHYIKFGKEEK